MRIYVASSWRNDFQRAVVQELRVRGHQVYDFREPMPGRHGFAWTDIDEDWENWTPDRFHRGLYDPIAEAGFRLDFQALRTAQAGVLVLPCGRSAHLEAGYLAGMGKPVGILLASGEPELMYRLADSVCVGFNALLQWADDVALGLPASPAPPLPCWR